MTSTWQRLDAAVRAEKARRNASIVEDTTNEIRRRVRRLAEELRLCPRQAQHWRRKRNAADSITVELSDNSAARLGKHPAIPLNGLDGLRDGALLAFKVDIEKSESLRAYSFSLVGQLRDVEQGWYARIDLTAKPEGEGLCSHPLLHCQLGRDPEEVHLTHPRVPLPWLMPWDALDWLLATADPRLEPEPHEP